MIKIGRNTMTTDEVLEILAETPVRGVSLYLWPEDVNWATAHDEIVAIISDLNLWPAKIYLKEAFGKKGKSLKCKSCDDVYFKGTERIEEISVFTTLPKKLSNIDSLAKSINISQEHRHVYFEAPSATLEPELAVQIIQRLMPFFTPCYGFSDVSRYGDCTLFHSGTKSSGMNETRRARADAFDQIKWLSTKNKLDGLGYRLFDVYELNFLNSAHLSLPAFGTTLENWIVTGNRGSLSKLKNNLFTWVVQTNILPDVRERLLREKCLVVPL
jgi:hypothetical protein